MAIVGLVRANQLKSHKAQCTALQAEGVKCIYIDDVLASTTERPMLAKAIGTLSPGDTLCAASAAVLADNAAHLVDVLDQVRARGAELIILDLGGARLDTATAAGQYMGRVLLAVTQFDST
jgi:DNA invertase Pin-like site-specific DNA recombinase